MPRMTLSDDDLRHTYNRAVAATDKPYPDAYLEGLRALVAAGWGEGYADGFGDGGVNAWDPANPYRGDGGE